MAGSHSKRNSTRVADSACAIPSANPPKDLPNAPIGGVSQSYCPKEAISPVPARNARMPAAVPQLRHWTVGYRHRHPKYTFPHGARRRPEPPPVPFLPLQGRWLHQAGFTIGASVRVLVTAGRLVLEVDDFRGDTRTQSPGNEMTTASSHSTEKAVCATGPARAPVCPPRRHDGPEEAKCLGELIAKLRRRLQIRREDVAYRAWISPAYLYAIERGRRLPSLAVFIMLSRAVGLDPRELLDGLLKQMHYGYGAPPVFQPKLRDPSTEAEREFEKLMAAVRGKPTEVA